jgi:hypothetical protein
MKQLIELLDEKTNYNGWAKPCTIYINQAKRNGVVVKSSGDNFNVAYAMPNGRMYVKKITPASGNLLNIDLTKSFNEDGTTFNAFGF